ncbi:protein of unknown function [Enterobacter cancerogenus]|nr:protein of unknown function [Enterobacter cancerogenus]
MATRRVVRGLNRLPGYQRASLEKSHFSKMASRVPGSSIQAPDWLNTGNLFTFTTLPGNDGSFPRHTACW